MLLHSGATTCSLKKPKTMCCYTLSCTVLFQLPRCLRGVIYTSSKTGVSTHPCPSMINVRTHPQVQAVKHTESRIYTGLYNSIFKFLKQLITILIFHVLTTSQLPTAAVHSILYRNIPSTAGLQQQQSTTASIHIFLTPQQLLYSSSTAYLIPISTNPQGTVSPVSHQQGLSSSSSSAN